jgi:hypothetical protein
MKQTRPECCKVRNPIAGWRAAHHAAAKRPKD